VTKEKISEYDASADGNTDVNGVNIAEGCAPSGINNAIREVMGALKRFETGADGDSITVGGNLVVSGSTTANTIGATVVNASGNATVGGTLVVTGATTFSGNVVVSGSTTATTVSAAVVQSDTISEKTSAAGVTVDGVLLKDTTVTANTIKASGTASSQGEVQLFEDTDNGTNYVAIKAAASIASNVTFVLPNADGTSGQALVTNGSGSLSFSSAGGGNYILRAYTSPATWTKPAGLKAVKVTVVGGGAGNGAASPYSVSAGGTSSFGPFLSATGGAAYTSPALGAGGSGSGGDINMSGGDGAAYTGGGAGALLCTGPGGGNTRAGYPFGGGASPGGGGGGGSIEYISAPSIPGPVTVTVGAGSAGAGPAPNAPSRRSGAPGIVVVEEFY
jgi:hypothetical protein